MSRAGDYNQGVRKYLNPTTYSELPQSIPPGGINIYLKLTRGSFAPKIGGYNLKINGGNPQNNPRIDIYLGILMNIYLFSTYLVSN